jgi:ABC-type transporter Mla MlaB component
MLRVQMHDSANGMIFKLEGRFTDGWADRVRTLVTQCPTQVKLVIDLTDVTFVDSAGEEVLLFLRRFGAVFIAETSYTLDFCDRLSLPLAGNKVSGRLVATSAHTSGYDAVPDSGAGGRRCPRD